MKAKITLLIIPISIISLLLGACDVGKEDTIDEIKYDLSIEYKVPIADVKVETIEYGVTITSTNQFKVTIKDKASFYLVEKDNAGNNFRRIPIEE